MPVNPQLLANYRRQIGGYRIRTSALLIAAWDALDSHDEADVAEFEDRTSTGLAGAKLASVNLSAAFFSLALGIPQVGVQPDDIDLEPDTRGPFRAMWHAFTMGRAFEEALGVGRSTAQAVGFDFVQSTARRTGDLVAVASGQTVKWKRQPTARSCDWCRLVAGQTYNTAESADFGHERDDCDVVPAI
jgi:hypothetical protein